MLGESWPACRLSCSPLPLGFVSHTQWKGLCLSCRGVPTSHVSFPVSKEDMLEQRFMLTGPGTCFQRERVDIVLSSFPPCLPPLSHRYCRKLCLAVDGRGRGGKSPFGSTQSSCNLNGLPRVPLGAAQSCDLLKWVWLWSLPGIKQTKTLALASRELGHFPGKGQGELSQQHSTGVSVTLSQGLSV